MMSLDEKVLREEEHYDSDSIDQCHDVRGSLGRYVGRSLGDEYGDGCREVTLR